MSLDEVRSKFEEDLRRLIEEHRQVIFGDWDEEENGPEPEQGNLLLNEFGVVASWINTGDRGSVVTCTFLDSMLRYHQLGLIMSAVNMVEG